MADSLHNPQHEQHLIAYLDGELDSEERQLAEKIMDENPALVELLEQWRENGKALRALPRYRLDDSFTERVLASLDHETVIHDAVGASSLVSGGEVASPIPWRAGLAALATLAALLLVAFSFLYPGTDGDSVAGTNEPDGAIGMADTDTDSGEAGDVVGPAGLANHDRKIIRPSMATTLKHQDGTEPISSANLIRSAGAESVEHVFVISMADPASGIANLEGLCIGNSVRIVRSESPLEDLERSQPLQELLGSSPQIQNGAEAIFAVATAGQMKKVIREISEGSGVQLLPSASVTTDPSGVVRLNQWLELSEDGENPSRLIPYLLWIHTP